MHRLIPVGISGFLLNMSTGICFICAAPDQYLFNAAFRWKVVFITIAGLNVLFFYTRVFRRLESFTRNTTPRRWAHGSSAGSRWRVGWRDVGGAIAHVFPP